MKKVYLVLVLLCLFSGCAEWIQRSNDISTTGEAFIETGTIITTASPVIGVWIVTVGGSLLAIGKILSIFKERKDGNTID